MALPSAVNIRNIGQAVVPDNSRAMAQLGQIGAAAGQAWKRNRDEKKKEKRTGELVDQLTGGETVDFARQNPTPEQQQAQLQAEQIDNQEQQQLITVKQQAAQNRESARQNFNLSTIMNDPESVQAFIELQDLNPQVAEGILDAAKYNDAMQNRAINQQAAEAQHLWGNVSQMYANGNDEGAQSLVKATMLKRHKNGEDISQMQPFFTMNKDQQAAFAEQNFALSGGAIAATNAVDKLKLQGLELDIEQKRRDLAGVGQDSISSRQRQQQLDLDREKFTESKTKLSAGAEKQLFASQDAANESEQAASQMESMAQEFDNLDVAGGLAGKTSEKLKEVAGSEDAATALRKRYLAMRNSQVVKNLPPGVASDKDIEMVLSGYLSETANPTQIASFLRGMSKIESYNARFQTFKSQMISDKGNTRGFLSAWKQHQEQAIEEQQATDPLGLR